MEYGILYLKPWFHVKIKIILKNFSVYFNTEPRLKRDKIILAAKIILFHFRRGEVKLFQTRAAAVGRPS